MVNLLTGPKGTGKTQQLIDLANKAVKDCNGHVVFIKKTHRDTSSLSFDIRVICMADYEAITNIDEYLGFLYGMISINHDVEQIFIDGIMKHANISLDNIPEFIEHLKKFSSDNKIDCVVSISATADDLANVDLSDCKILNA